MRRTHRKSRYGCKVCKQRHIKCDESKPSCLNCIAVDRRCSFLDNISSVPSPTVSARHSPRPSLPPSSHACHESAPPPTALGEDYTLSHMELFHHFEHNLSSGLGPSHNHAVKESFHAPFLMDEILALAAAHKSTLDPARKETYLAEATRLQTRGLSRFNAAQTQLSDENCLAIFMYSAVLGQHVLFDTFSLRSDFAAVMSKLVQCLSLHGGIRTIASSSWAKIHKEVLNGDTYHLKPVEPVKPTDECGPLLTLLDGSELSGEAKADCQNAIEGLQLIFARKPGENPRAGLFVQEWAVRVPKGYIGLLNERRPEAMVILGYYAVLLHYDRSSWAIGDTGAYLIRSLVSHLGEYWTRWLEWPRRVIEDHPTPELTGSNRSALC